MEPVRIGVVLMSYWDGWNARGAGLPQDTTQSAAWQLGWIERGKAAPIKQTNLPEGDPAQRLDGMRSVQELIDEAHEESPR
jgi:hypothetical protein